MAAQVNLIIDQGGSFYQEVNLFDENGDALVTHTGATPIYTAAAQMRKSYQATNAVSFSTAISNGVLTLTMTPNTTANIVAGRYVYDVEVASGEGATYAVTKIVSGIVTVKPEATRV